MKKGIWKEYMELMFHMELSITVLKQFTSSEILSFNLLFDELGL